mgnify:CR=1 FL=1
MLDKVSVETLQREAFREDVLAGLSAPQKTLPSRWLYDVRGSELFEAITQLDEYYPTRTETAILRRHVGEMAAFAGLGRVILEYGAGAGIKSELLIEAAKPRLYVPIDIAGDFLDFTIARLADRFPDLETRAVIADFTTEFDLPSDLPAGRIGFFPGSTIGNLDREQMHAFLVRMRRHVGRGGTAIVGADLKKDIAVLHAAYDDREGVTAEFNLNLLARINRELGGDFALGNFVHEARWNDTEGAIEMHLVSRVAQAATIEDRTFSFEAGETIHTESSRKYERDEFAEAARAAGWETSRVWLDDERKFSVFGLSVAAG